jgi:hypothetical protein
MRIKKCGAKHRAAQVAVALLLLLPCVSVSAQGGKTDKLKARPDLSGTWELDQAQTKPRSSKAAASNRLTLLISHREPEIRMTRRSNAGGRERTREAVYYTDGRGEKNLGSRITSRPDAPEQELQSKTRWKGDKLVTTTTIREAVASTFMTWEITDEWKLSADDQTLVQTTIIRQEGGDDQIRAAPPGRPLPSGTVIFIPAGPREFKNVFRRVAE